MYPQKESTVIDLLLLGWYVLEVGIVQVEDDDDQRSYL